MRKIPTRARTRARWPSGRVLQRGRSSRVRAEERARNDEIERQREVARQVEAKKRAEKEEKERLQREAERDKHHGLLAELVHRFRTLLPELAKAEHGDSTKDIQDRIEEAEQLRCPAAPRARAPPPHAEPATPAAASCTPSGAPRCAS